MINFPLPSPMHICWRSFFVLLSSSFPRCKDKLLHVEGKYYENVKVGKQKKSTKRAARKYFNLLRGGWLDNEKQRREQRIYRANSHDTIAKGEKSCTRLGLPIAVKSVQLEALNVNNKVFIFISFFASLPSHCATRSDFTASSPPFFSMLEQQTLNLITA